jgi:uncharacterized protein (DUF1778 family)
MQSSVLSVRLSETERDLLERAASDARTSVSDFVRRSALEAAELEAMERSQVKIPADQWESFEQWAKSPGEPVKELQELARFRPTWSR